MTTLRDQEKLAGDIRPLVVNVMNFSKGADGAPTLLSFDDARTLFHEFGHALHGLLSDVTYPLISGTSVLTRFRRAALAALRALAGAAGGAAPVRRALPDRRADAGGAAGAASSPRAPSTRASRRSNMSRPRWSTSTSTRWPSADEFDSAEFEQTALARIDMPAEIVMRHRPPHFAHIFSGGGYASAYYSYMWSEVLDADAFAAFEETGDVFDPATARKLHDHIYSAGGSRDPADAYTRLPRPAADSGRAAAQARARRSQPT